LNAWGAFIISLLVANGVQQPFNLMVQSMPFNFYPLVLLPLMCLMIIRRKDLGLLRSARPHSFEESVTPSGTINRDRPMYLILPILSLVISLPALLVWDGWLSGESGGLLDRIFASIGRASGTKSVLLAVVLSIMVTGFQSRIRHGRWRNGFSQSVLQGTVELVPLALLMILAFAIGQACRDLETGIYLSSVVQSWIPSALLPMIIFLIACLVSFSTGTSWGTFAIMMSISIPLAESASLHLPLVVAAVLSGGVFGDHCSPISDTTIISSMASGSDHIAHVQTQMPYALIAGGVSAVFFAIAGFLV
jgi:Na+/H+ antiporter NhaC